MRHEELSELLTQYQHGRVSRRTLLQGATALGLSAQAATLLAPRPWRPKVRHRRVSRAAN